MTKFLQNSLRTETSISKHVSKTQTLNLVLIDLRFKDHVYAATSNGTNTAALRILDCSAVFSERYRREANWIMRQVQNHSAAPSIVSYIF